MKEKKFKRMNSKEIFIVADTVGDNIFQWNVKLS
jgi:hypothetical protein